MSLDKKVKDAAIIAKVFVQEDGLSIAPENGEVGHEMIIPFAEWGRVHPHYVAPLTHKDSYEIAKPKE